MTRNLYRITAVIFVLFAAGHTFGFLTFKPPTPEAAAVLSSMHSVHFSDGSGSYSLGDFYVGFGLSISVNMLFFAFLSWQLASLSHMKALAPLAWGFFALQLPAVVLGWIYFGLPPAIFSTVVAVLLGWAARSLSKGKS